MKFQKYKFNNNLNVDFANTLKNRVNEYFKNNNLSKFANLHMVVKSTVMIMLYFVPFALMLTGIITLPWLAFLLWGIMGVGMAGIGTCIMHDALHGGYSKNKKVNDFLGLSMNFIGGNAGVWKMQHNVLHHSYTNIAHADDDIKTPIFLRFSSHQKRIWIHRFQYLYVWFFYSISTIFWVTTKDFVQIFRYKKRGLVKNNQELIKSILNIFIWKLVYYAYVLILPILLLPFSPGLIILMFISMHLVSGFLLSIVFQPAHVVPTTSFLESQDSDKIETNWTVHQLLTTSNFAPNNKLLSWFIGGLNFQVEHHLFPNICHIHYPKLSKIVQETTSEFGNPYHYEKSYRTALKSHVKMLQMLGTQDSIPNPGY